MVETKIFPEIMNDSIEMEIPNTPILIYAGKFFLTHDEISIELEGKIEFVWFPNQELKFSGNVISQVNSFKVLENEFILKDKSQKYGSCQRFSGKSTTERVTFLSGIINNPIKGDECITVSQVKFSIPNLRDLRTTTTIQKDRGDGNIDISTRCILEDEKYIIHIDRKLDHQKKIESLKEQGGYLILYNGSIAKKGNHSISLKEIPDLVLKLSYFLSFVNGSRCSPIFIKGMFEEEEKWVDYNGYITEPFQITTSWLPRHNNSLEELWSEFSTLWQEEDNRDFLITAIHWYTESNSKKSIVEGSLIMAQASLELIYNWLVVETNGIIKGKDAVSITASNKIRLLLNQCQIENVISPNLKELNKLISNHDFLIDGPETIVYLRNAVVHSQLEKRKSLKKIELMVKYEALQLSLSFIELAILSILKYNKRYNNRCESLANSNLKEPLVPWA